MPSIEEYKQKFNCIDGYTEIDVSGRNANRYFGNEEEMIEWIDQPSIVPFLPVLDDNIKDEFRNDVIKEMIERTKCKDGRCFEEFKRINVSAVKR